MNKLIPLIIFLVIGIFLFLSLNSDPKKLPSPLVGKSFPVIEGADFYTNEKVKFKDLMDNQVSWSMFGPHGALPVEKSIR